MSLKSAIFRSEWRDRVFSTTSLLSVAPPEEASVETFGAVSFWESLRERGYQCHEFMGQEIGSSSLIQLESSRPASTWLNDSDEDLNPLRGFLYKGLEG